MPSDQVSATRHTQGIFQARHEGRAPWSRAARAQQRWGRTGPLLRMDSVANAAVALLYASTVLNSTAQATATQPQVSPQAPSTDASWTIGSAIGAAQATSPYLPVTLQPPARPVTGLHAVANGALLSCMHNPRTCGTVLLGSGLVAAGLFTRDALLHARGSNAASDPIALPPDGEDALVQAVAQMSGGAPDGQTLQDALLRIARDCGGDRQCRATAINALLETLPALSLAELQQMVAVTAASPAAAFPGAVDAAAVASLASPLQDLVDLLSALYTPETAAFQDDMQSIVNALPAEPLLPLDQQWRRLNSARQHCIAALFERDGHTVERLPYVIEGLAYMGLDDPEDAWNLLITPVSSEDTTASPGSRPARRILLVAHGDMIGLGKGSRGAYDNASGVAGLLHVARDPALRAAAGRNAQIQLLITSHEELGLLGSRAYVDACRQAGDCPELVINIDMIGRGGHHYLISASDALVGHRYLGRPPLNLQEPVLSAHETRAREQLQAAFAAAGFSLEAAADTPLMTSDNIAFQNASIPCLSLAQLSPDDVAAWRRHDQAHHRWSSADAGVDWNTWWDWKAGTLTLSAAAETELGQRHAAADAAWNAFQVVREDLRFSARGLIHGAGDQLSRINPQHGTRFADALAAFVVTWASPPDEHPTG